MESLPTQRHYLVRCYPLGTKLYNILVVGVSHGAEGLGRLAEAVYRGILHALPASARAWFGDLRDRGLAAAVEVSLALAVM